MTEKTVNMKTATGEEVSVLYAENAGSGKGKRFLPEVAYLSPDQLTSLPGTPGIGEPDEALFSKVAEQMASLAPVRVVIITQDKAQLMKPAEEN